MKPIILKFRDWTLEAEKELTQLTYEKVTGSGADTCVCNHCKNYVAYREKVFPVRLKVFSLISELTIGKKLKSLHGRNFQMVFIKSVGGFISMDVF